MPEFFHRSSLAYIEDRIHGIDLTEYLDSDQTNDHAQMTLVFLYEFAFANF